MAVVCGLAPTPGGARPFSSRCPPAPHLSRFSRLATDDWWAQGAEDRSEVLSSILQQLLRCRWRGAGSSSNLHWHASLRSLGYNAHVFPSAEEFIAGDGEVSYDCAVTDIHMPRMSGFDLKRLLTVRGSNMPVTMITARAEPVLEAKAAACSAVCLLRKPFEANALTNCLQRALKV